MISHVTLLAEILFTVLNASLFKKIENYILLTPIFSVGLQKQTNWQTSKHGPFDNDQSDYPE